jgi:hypothetical protein
MITGWKLNPHWRLYYEMKRQHRLLRLREAREREEQMAALDAYAEQITSYAAREAQRNNEPRH